MKKTILITGLGLMLSLVTLFIGCNNDDDPKDSEEVVVIANRGSGNVSFIDANTDKVTHTLAIVSSEPMYVVYVPATDKVYVGDRGGKKVHVINPDTRVVERSISVGSGVFHMWADGQGKQLWVNNDVDNTISVIDLKKDEVVQTINVGAKPHDIFLNKDASKAYVSIISPGSDLDKVYMYSTSTYSKTAEVSVGKDPHLYLLSNTNKLFVPCQSGQVYTLDGNDLKTTSKNVFIGAHGIFASPDQSTVFVSNITGNQLYSINASTSAENGVPVGSLSKTPHNIVVNSSGSKMYVTHSGASASLVSTYGIKSGILEAGATITVGSNPFGLAYYSRKKK